MPRPTCRRRLLLPVCLLLPVIPLAAAEPAMHGYFGDRSGVYPQSKPPLRWDEKTNVLWKVPVPNLGNAAPIVAGERVFVLSEPGWKHDLPVLSCYSLADGKALWEKEIDHLHLTVPDEDQRKKIREAWHKHLAWCRDFYLLYHDYVASKDSADVKRRMDEMGLQSWGANYLYGKCDQAKVSEFSMYSFSKKHPEIGKALMGLDTWRCMGSHDFMWIGEVFGTPCTDGQAIYVATAWGVYASYDLSGNLRWMHALPVNPPHDYCSRARSPLIYKDLVISDLGSMVRAFDRATGALRWDVKRDRREGYDTHEFVSPVLFRVGTQDLLWCAGPAAYTLPEGKPLKVEGWKNNGMILAVDAQRPDTLFFTGGGEHGGWEGKGKCDHPPPAAVRFTLAGDTLKARVLWSTINGQTCGGCAGMVAHGGRLYFAGGRGVILDTETGNVIRGLSGGAVPATSHHMALAGGYVYGLSERGEMTVCTDDGRPVAKNALRVTPFAELDRDSQTKRLSQWYSWPKGENKDWCFSYSAPFAIAGNRIFIRSLDDLYCIGDKDGGATAAIPANAVQQADALLADTAKNKDVWSQLAALGPEAKAVAPRLEALLAKHPEPLKPLGALAVIDPEAARRHRDLLVKAIVGSNLSDYVTPQAGEMLYALGPMPREMLAPIEAKVDERMYPLGGPRSAESLLSAFYRRSGDVGFTQVHVHPLPWEGTLEPGKDIKLRWSTVNATKVRIEPGIGEVEKEGEKTIQLQQPAEYTFTAEGPGGPSVRKVTIRLKTGGAKK